MNKEANTERRRGVERRRKNFNLTSDARRLHGQPGRAAAAVASDSAGYAMPSCDKRGRFP
jgi:hypothetical protein